VLLPDVTVLNAGGGEFIVQLSRPVIFEWG
jgi:hypothetical protein